MLDVHPPTWSHSYCFIPTHGYSPQRQKVDPLHYPSLVLGFRSWSCHLKFPPFLGSEVLNSHPRWLFLSSHTSWPFGWWDSARKKHLWHGLIPLQQSVLRPHLSKITGWIRWIWEHHKRWHWWWRFHHQNGWEYIYIICEFHHLWFKHV